MQEEKPLYNLTIKSEAEQKKIWDDAIFRLTKIAKVDRPFFLLALHSLVEAWLNENLKKCEYDNNGDNYNERTTYFKEKVNMMCKLITNEKCTKALNFIAEDHEYTNKIRHYFSSSSIRACDNCKNLAILSELNKLASQKGIIAIEELIKSLNTPDDKTKFETEQKAIDYRLREIEKKEKDLEEEIVKVKVAQKEKEELEKQNEVLNNKLIDALLRNDEKDEKNDKLRAEKNTLSRLLEDKNAYLEKQKEKLEYLDLLKEVHRSSRTALEYEQTLLRLSEDQEYALNAFKPGMSFLIRGGAGTGKTMVLISAIKKLRSNEAQSLGFEIPQKIILLTYTGTLKRYSQYLAELLTKDKNSIDTDTVDHYFLELGKNILGYTISYRFNDDARKELAPNLDLETWSELEDFIWARGLTKEDYTVKRIPRTGRKNPIAIEKRNSIWQTGEEIFIEMQKKAVYSRFGLRAAILKELDKQSEINSYKEYNIIAVDEIQDLGPVDLKILARLSDSLLMAGDTRQSIYQVGFTFKSALINIQAHSRLLSVNFRNTRQIAQVTNKFLLKSSDIDEDPSDIKSYRDGLAPRLDQFNKNEGFIKSVQKELDFYQHILGYNDSSIAILHQGLDDTKLNELKKHLEKTCKKHVDIKNNETWLDSEGIRISTIKSAKGLDFPVVILVVQKLFQFGGLIDDDSRHLTEANLIYVGITRALENLSVVLPKEANASVLNNLRDAFAITENTETSH